MGLFDDLQMGATQAALDAVAQRQRVTAHNIANIATPGFRATRLSFEDSLRGAIEDGRPAEYRADLTGTRDAARFDGNNVSLEDETAILVKSGLHYEALVESLNYKLRLLRTAIGRG